MVNPFALLTLMATQMFIFWIDIDQHPTTSVYYPAFDERQILRDQHIKGIKGIRPANFGCMICTYLYDMI